MNDYYHRERPLFAFGWRAAVVIALATIVYLALLGVAQ